MHESTELGMGMSFVGMGWGMRMVVKFMEMGVGMGLIFNTVSLFNMHPPRMDRETFLLVYNKEVRKAVTINLQSTIPLMHYGFVMSSE